MRKKTSKKHTKRHKQHLYKMIGCSKKHTKKMCPICGLKGGSGCGANGCPIAPLSWSEMNKFVGGNCDVMGCKPILGVGQNGGTNMAIPGPLVGSPWGPNDNQLPGANGVAGDRNYLASYANVIQNDPTRQISMNDANFKPILIKGGKRKSRKSKKRKNKSFKRGGGLLPQDLVNLGREVGYNFKSAYNAINGYKAPVNPLPYKDQLQSSSIAIMSK